MSEDLYDFVEPDVQRIELARGRWIDVKVELTAGETRAMFGRMRPYVTPGETNQLIAKEVGIARLVAYLVDWSLKDRSGKRVPLTDAAIDGLTMATFQELIAAVDAHVEIQDAKRLAEKNGRAELSNSAPI